MATKTNTEINGKTYYRIKRVVGHEYIDGKRVPITKQFYGKSKGDAENKYRDYKDELIRQEYERRDSLTMQSRRTVGEMMDYYIRNVFENNASYSIGTRDLYIGSYNTHLVDSDLIDIRMSDLNSDHIQSFYNSLKTTESGLNTLHKFMKLFVKWASSKGYCNNVLEAVALPEKKKNRLSDDIIVWTDKEVDMIKERLSGHPYYPCILFGLYAGLRVSEVLGLKWSDIYDDTIHIRRQNYRMTIKDPKVGSSRDVPLHPIIKEALEDVPRQGDYIFCTKSGRLIDYHNFEHSLARAYKKAGIEHKKFHAFRATFITNLCRAGARLEVASKLAGHQNVNITAKYYTEISRQESSNAIDLLK